MITKFRTPIVAIAVKADKSLPPEMRKLIEYEIQLYINLYSTSVMRGAHERLLAMIHEFCVAEMKMTLEELGQMPQASVVCEDWKRGLRNPHGNCTNCGAKH